MSLTFARSVWSLAILAPAAWLARPRGPVRPTDWARFIVLALVNSMMNVLYPIAAQHTSAAHLTLVYAANAPIVALFESIFRRVNLDNQRKLAAVFGGLGVIVLAFTKSTSGSTLFGDAILFVWLFGFGAQAILTRVLCARHSPYFVTGFSWGLSALLIVAVGLPFGLERGLHETVATPLVGAVFLLVIVLGMSFLAPTAYAVAAKQTTAAIATGTTYYIAIAVGLILAMSVLGERIHAGGIAAGTLLVIGIALMMAPPVGRRRAGI